MIRLSWLLLLSLLVLAPSAEAARRMALMRGTLAKLGPSTFEYIGDESALARASLSGVSGQETFEANMANLRELMSLFERAHRGRMGPGAASEPLHVLLDPNETWAYARWGYPFRLRYPDGRITTPPSGFVHLGEQFDYSSRPTELTSAEIAANKELLAELDAYYAARLTTRDNASLARHVARKVSSCVNSVSITNEPYEVYVANLRRTLEKANCPLGDFDAWVAEFETKTPGTAIRFTEQMSSRYRFTLQGKQGSLDVYAEGMPHDQFRKEVARLMEDDLKARGAAQRMSWSSFYEGSKPAATAQRLRRDTIVAGINEAFTHEVGHMVHFEATAGQTGNSGDSGNPLRRGSHSAHTLSNGPFALAEGWAEAMAMTYGRQPSAHARALATRIDYEESIKALREYVNGLYAGAVTARLRARGLLGAKETLAVSADDPMHLDTEKFRAEVAKAAAARGLGEAELKAVDAQHLRDPRTAPVFRRLEYIEDLQAHKGEPKKRHDFLASESSVAVALLGIREELGATAFSELIDVMRASKPQTLARLLEEYAGSRPDRRVAVYRSLVKSTDGILVTTEQARLVESSPSLQIDLDRDGKVPGTNAARVRPDLFPPESLSFKPLPWLKPGEDPLAPLPEVAASPALSRTETVESETHSTGITPYRTEETLDFTGLERQ